MLLSHHWPEDYNRCVQVRHTHICRRCLVLYPTAAVSFVAARLTDWWRVVTPQSILALGVALVVSELVGEQLGWWRYSATRQVVVSIVGGLAAGRLFDLYLADRTNSFVWATVGVAVTIGFVASLAGQRRRASRAARRSGETRSSATSTGIS